MHTHWCVLIEISIEIGMLNFWLGLLVTALMKETYFSTILLTTNSTSTILLITNSTSTILLVTNSTSTNFIPITQKFVLVEFVLVETVLLEDPLYAF